MLSREAILSRLKIGSRVESIEHHALSKEMIESLGEQFGSMARRDLSGYSCEQHRSHQRGASMDVFIYDAAGVLKFEGRKFPGASGIPFWKTSG
jgi:hypothetical protein